MPINIHSVSNHLESEGWKLISTTYKNLKTELEMVCPKGHVQLQTYENWRKHMQCDKCLAGDTSRIQNKVPPKQENTTRILALDAATIVSGYAVYDNTTLVNYGTFKAEKSMNTEARIDSVKKWLTAVIKEWEIDYVGLENIQLQTYGSGNNTPQVELYRALANLQGVLLNTLFEASIDHGLVYSTVWRKFCNVGEGTGRENKKRQAQEKVKLWYGRDCTQDEADAICIGKYFSQILKSAKTTWGEDI